MHVTALALFFGLCATSFYISHYSKRNLKRFLDRNIEISNYLALEDYKSLVRKQMWLGLLMICVLLFVILTIPVLFWLGGVKAVFSLAMLKLIISSLESVASLENKAKALQCSNRSLQTDYKSISNTWTKKAFPDF